MGPQVEQVSRIAAPAAVVWQRVVTPEGINDELRPWLRMTIPAALRAATIDDVRTGERLGRSWLLLGGLVPVDFDDLCLAELEPGRRFLERSTMLSMRTWQHERLVEPEAEDACVVTDRLTFRPRRPLAWLPGVEALAAGIVRRLFAHRHRRLGAWARSQSSS